MASSYQVCPWCKKSGFKNRRGLTQHQNSSERCKALMRQHHGYDLMASNRTNFLQVARVFPESNNKSRRKAPLSSTIQNQDTRMSNDDDLNARKIRRISYESDDTSDTHGFKEEKHMTGSVSCAHEIPQPIDRQSSQADPTHSPPNITFTFGSSGDGTHPAGTGRSAETFGRTLANRRHSNE